MQPRRCSRCRKSSVPFLYSAVVSARAAFVRSFVLLCVVPPVERISSERARIDKTRLSVVLYPYSISSLIFFSRSLNQIYMHFPINTPVPFLCVSVWIVISYVGSARAPASAFSQSFRQSAPRAQSTKNARKRICTLLTIYADDMFKYSSGGWRCESHAPCG